jgi:excinuclease ABC subunit C
MEISKKTFLKLPEVPGVYTFWKKNIPIYIGKSVNLKSRLNSYLDLHLGVKTSQMMKEADSVSYTKVTSDLEALLLESYQIKKYKPKYNILLKDDKHALYIVITKEDYPRVLSVRKLMADQKQLIASFGPFPSSTNVRMILKMIRKIFPFSDHKIGKKPCLYSHIGLCNPCPSEILATTDLSLKSKKRKQYLKNIKNLKLVLSRKFNAVRKSLEKEMNLLSINEKYEEARLIRDRIKTLDYITQEKIETEKFLSNPNLVEDIREEEIESLRGLVNIKSLKHIECFDIAHLSGSNPTASMVVMVNGDMDHSKYKHFKIRQQNGQSDYDSMREVSKRRIKHLTDWGRPDLIIVDGGLGQVKIFETTFREVEIPIVGIAKHPDRLVFPNGKKIRLKDATLNLVSRLRDEAHRFSRRLHHKLLTKSLLK